MISKKHLILSAFAATLLFSSEGDIVNLKNINLIATDNNKTASNLFAPHEAIIVFKEGTKASEMIKTFQNMFGSKMKHNEYNLINGMHIVVPGKSFDEIKRIIENMPMADKFIKSVEKNSAALPFKSNDTYYDKLWAIENNGQNVNNKSGTKDADMDIDEAWKIEKGEHGVVVAVLDTGVDYTHTDLQDNMWNGNAYHGYDFAGDNDGNNDEDPMPDKPYDDNEHSHGTHVAGIIGAVGDNDNGISGVAQNVQIMALKVFRPNGYGYTSDILEALDYVSKQIDNGVNIVAINASYGSGGGQQGDSVDEAIAKLGDKGVVFCAAAGNDGKDIDKEPVYPAAYSASNIITVAASDQDDKLASFSNFGKKTVEVAAPGTNILSTYPDNQYAYMQGTSMATPYVTGTVALLASVNPGSSVKDRIKAITEHIDVKNDLNGKVATNGRVNAFKAVEALDNEDKNSAPIANNDSVETKYETKVAIDVLKNDSDEDGDALTIKSATNPKYGSVTIKDNKIIYTPQKGFSGDDSFNYTISDSNGKEDSAVVKVKVDKKTDNAPIAKDDEVSTEYETAVIIDVLKNDSDEDGDALTIKTVFAASNGKTEIQNGKIKYTPNRGFSGKDEFEYSISDGNGSDAKAKVIVTVKKRDSDEKNHAPIAKADSVKTAYETKVLIDALANDTDADGDSLKIKSIGTPNSGKAEIKDGKILYTPKDGFSGKDKFGYTIIDEKGAEDSSVIEVDVKDKKNTPPKANDDKVATDFETKIVIDVLANDTDADGDLLTIKSAAQPANGTVDIKNNKIIYSPSRGFSGIDTFRYTVSDSKGGISYADVTVDVQKKEQEDDKKNHSSIIGDNIDKGGIKFLTGYSKEMDGNYTSFSLNNNKAKFKVYNNGEVKIENAKAPVPQNILPAGTKVEVDGKEIKIEMTLKTDYLIF